MNIIIYLKINLEQSQALNTTFNDGSPGLTLLIFLPRNEFTRQRPPNPVSFDNEWAYFELVKHKDKAVTKKERLQKIRENFIGGGIQTEIIEGDYLLDREQHILRIEKEIETQKLPKLSKKPLINWF